MQTQKTEISRVEHRYSTFKKGLEERATYCNSKRYDGQAFGHDIWSILKLLVPVDSQIPWGIDTWSGKSGVGRVRGRISRLPDRNVSSGGRP